MNHARAEVLLANLSIREDMPAFYGVFIPPKDRDREYGLTPGSEAYVEFLTQTVVPAAEDALGLQITPRNRVLVGPSLGGTITLYTAFMRPDVFPFAASQSAAMDERKETLFKLINQSPFGKPEIGRAHV